MSTQKLEGLIYPVCRYCGPGHGYILRHEEGRVSLNCGTCTSGFPGWDGGPRIEIPTSVGEGMCFREDEVEFTWLKGSDRIEMYSVSEDGRIGNRLGFITTERDGKQIDFNEDAFQEHCRWLMDEISKAEIRDEGEEDV